MSVNQSVGLLVGRSVGRSIGRSFGRSVDWMVVFDPDAYSDAKTHLKVYR